DTVTGAVRTTATILYKSWGDRERNSAENAANRVEDRQLAAVAAVGGLWVRGSAGGGGGGGPDPGVAAAGDVRRDRAAARADRRGAARRALPYTRRRLRGAVCGLPAGRDHGEA